MIPLAVFDLETTGVDPLEDRIVTAYFGLLRSDGSLEWGKEWIVDPGVPIPEGASNVHGWTPERLAEYEGTRHDPQAVTLEIATVIWKHCDPNGEYGYALAGHNVSYDLTMLDSHLIRDGRAPLPFGAPIGINVIDTLVLDKKFDRYVKGSGMRKLTPTAARYGIELTEEQAHDASFDATASGRIAQAILAKHVPRIHDGPRAALASLHQQQVGWRMSQQADLEKWLRDHTDPDAVCDGAWPTARAR